LTSSSPLRRKIGFALRRSFKRRNGPVAPGEYSVDYGARLDLVVVGSDAAGAQRAELFTLGSTCEPFAEFCAFKRKVDVIP